MSWNSSTIDVVAKVLARDATWEAALGQYGYVTAQQATGMGVGKHALQMLVHRSTLERAAQGVYRFPRYPVGPYDGYMLAVLWTRLPETVLSHETALNVYGTSDINPHRIHLTVGKRRRLRRADAEAYAVHYEDLAPGQIGWWREIPTVTATTAIRQCIAFGTPTYLLRQAIERGHAAGYVTAANHEALVGDLEDRRG